MNEQVPGLTSMFSPTDYFVLASFSGQYQSVVHCGPGAVMSHVSPLNLTFLESKGSSEVVMIHTEELVPSILLFTKTERFLYRSHKE